MNWTVKKSARSLLACAVVMAASVAALAQNPAPTISSISPTSGPMAGGTTVTVTGANFQSGATVNFGSNAATNVTFVSSTTLTAVTPAGSSSGAVNVVVTNPDLQTGTLWAVQQPLTNPGFEGSPAGTGWVKTGFGTAQVINNPPGAHSGNNYAQLTVNAPNTQVNYVAQLNSTSQYLPVNPGDVISFSGWSYRVDTVGSGDGLARWQIEVTDSNKANPSYIASSPNNVATASWVQQSNTYTVAAGKAYLRFWCQITGTNGSVTAQANFDDASLTRTVPGGGFTYNGPPSLTVVSPNSGSVAGGTVVTLTGSNFLNGATVEFGAIAATGVTFVNSTTLKATTPAESQGTVNVTVTNPDTQSSTLNNAFTFVSAGPTLSSISPNSGPTSGGTSVTISGTNFLSGATVSIGGNAATNVTVVNSTTITATTPASAGGPANVVVTNPDSQSATLWAIQQPLTNAGFESTGGWTQTGFGTAQIINNPSGAHSGNNYAQLTVNAPDKQVNYVATLNGTSPYLPVNPGDVISFSGWTYRVDTNAGDGLARWQIEATDSNKANPSYIASNPNNVTTASWVQQSNTYTVATGKAFIRFWCQITATNGSVTAQANFDDASFTRTIPGGGFTYIAPPMLTSVNPTGGALAGGTLVTLGGANFLSGATATFGTSVVNTTFVSSTQLTALTPANSAGPVNVTVTNPDGQHSTLQTAYTYNPAPTITSIAPSSGPTSGGTLATISGSNFLNGAQVTFGGVSAQASVVSPSQISATTPANNPGLVNVVVTNPDNQSATLTNGFNYQGAAPTITSIAPNFGTANGGTAVNIHGSNFQKGATVSIGGSPVNNITFVGSTLLTGTTTAHVAGGADIVVTNPDTQSATYSSLLYNQGFESGNTQWSLTSKNGGSGNIYNCSSTGCGGNVNNAHTGTWYGELNAPVAKSQPKLFVADASGKSIYFPVLPGDVITFGGWAYRVSGDGSARWVLEISDSNKQNAIYVSAPPANNQDPQWELQQGTKTIPAGMAFIRFYCEISGNTVNATARFDDGILQRSPEATYGYTYVPAPYLTSISPNWGAPAGGTSRTVFGTGLCLLQMPTATCTTSGSPAAGTPPTVTVGGVAATNVVVNGTGLGQSQANQGNAITFFVPPGSAGAADVLLTAPDGQPSNTLSAAYTYQTPPAPPSGMTAIHHIIWELQENRSFDQYFGQMNAYRANNGINDNAVDGLPLNVSLPDIANQQIFPFKLQTECEENLQPSWNAQHLDYDNGLMDGFMKTGNMFSTSSIIDPNGTRAMGYYDWTDLPYYYSLGFNFATSDRFFSAAMANTGANRAYTIAGTSLGSVGTPGCIAGYNCDPTYGGFPNMTIFDLLQQAGISWRYYYQNSSPAWAGVWSTYGKYPGNFVPIGLAKPASGFFLDIQNESTFPQVVFIEENGALDEHPRPNPGTNNAPENIQLGANLMAGIIGGTSSSLPSLMNSPSWASSVFIETYDEGGGLHDHVVPPMVPIPDGYPPATYPSKGDQPGIFNQNGFRLPLMVISPWTIPHFVSHTPQDQTAILKLIETRFSLPPLTARDAAADNMLEFFEPNFASAPWATPPPTCNGTTITTNCIAPQPTNGVCNLNLEKAPGQ